jgi:hypothetical protein
LAPSTLELVATIGGTELTAIEFEAAGVELAEVVTENSRPPGEGGLSALKLTSTSLPAGIAQVLMRFTVKPPVLTPPPLVPPWKQAVSVSSTKDTPIGTEASGIDDESVTEPADEPDSSAVARNPTVKVVSTLSTTVLGEATTSLTPVVGVPIV